MNRYYVAIFPSLPEGSWISDFRDSNDPKSHLVPPHFTLFMPAELPSVAKLTERLEEVVASFEPFRVCLRSALLMPEKRKDGTTVGSIFLVPDEGFAALLRLHDLLYAGEFSPCLRLDIPFIPHMTIGSGIELVQAKTLADEINSVPFCIELEVDELCIVHISHPDQARRIDSTFSLQKGRELPTTTWENCFQRKHRISKTL